ncbi:unnamed protein product [Caretta caretta]
MNRGSCFFYALEKRRRAKKHVTCLLVEDGTPLMDPEELHERARAFYASLFSPDPTDAKACRVLWTKLSMDGLSFALLSLDQEKAFNRVDHRPTYALAIEPFLRLLRWRLTGLVLQEPELRLVLSAYADGVLLVVQDLVEACQAVYSAASSARVSWVKSSGLVVGDGWQASSLPPGLQAIRWSAGPLL